ncbi:hypothetical protein [Sinomonas atrocyanea]
MTERTCAETGLRLIEAAGEEAFRIAKDRHGALSVRKNPIVGPLPISPSVTAVDRRGRYDTVGSTIYLAEDRRCAYAEVLTGFRQERASVAKAAESIGMTVEDYIAQVTADAEANGVDVPWSVSVDWQMDRSVYRIRLPRTGWWVKVDDRGTLAALERLAPTVPGLTESLQVLTATSIYGEDRDLTTLLAQATRMQILDDGSEPLGISYASKTLFGRCWAYWDRRTDEGLGPGSNDLHQLASENVGPDPDFAAIADHYDLPVLGPHP